MKPKIPSQKKAYDALNTRLAKYMAQVQGIYDDICLRLANAVSLTDYDGVVEFLFKNFPELASLIEQLMADYAAQMNSLIYSGTSEEWKQSNLLQDLLVEKAMKVYGFDKGGDKYNRYFQTDNAALRAFQQRKDRGLNLSQKLWRQSDEIEKELECALSVAIERGTSAITLSKRLSQYLVDFPKLKADYTEKFGHAARCRDCEYASMRLARSEINMAYRTAEHLRWQQFDFILGFDVKLSGRHPAPDICDDLKGRYPKDFKFTGWHPNCYSCDSEVLTNAGWKRFYDVTDNDLILSLNPESLQPEWVGIKARQSYHYKGEMIHFFNKSLDCLVTPDHQMVYLNKCDGRIKKCSALSYTKGKGAFYRGCEYCADDVDTFTIGDKSIPFDLFCEFMGYWLSDGSIQSNSGVVISQQKGEPAFEKILSCIRHFGFSPRVVQSNVVFYNTPMRNYLKRFGTCACKYIPDEIKNASKRQILIFLDAFSICDGHRRPSKTFVGSHGNVFKSCNDEISYFTTSKRMASDLSELMLKAGHRPSLSVKGPMTTRKRDGSYIRGNYDCITIRECYSLTSTVFGKSAIPYDGTVYDLTLERNHIMYVMRNGKCFWGSNCMCYTVPVVMTDDEYMSDDRSNEVKDMPDVFKRWVLDNQDRISVAESRGTLPYFLKDNKSYYKSVGK